MVDPIVTQPAVEPNTPAPEPNVQVPAAPNPLLEPAGPTIPKGLEKFVGNDGSLDPSRMGNSYLESEGALRQKSQENAELRQALQGLSDQLNNQESNSPAPTAIPNTDDALQRLAENPQEYIKEISSGVMKELGDPLAKQMSLATLQQMHPELKDETFMGGLKTWMGTIPPGVAAQESTLDGSDYLINEYKRISGFQSATTQTGPSVTNSEGPSQGVLGNQGQRFTRSQIRELNRTDPKRYAILEGEIRQAYAEGRVDND